MNPLVMAICGNREPSREQIATSLFNQGHSLTELEARMTRIALTRRNNVQGLAILDRFL